MTVVDNDHRYDADAERRNEMGKQQGNAIGQSLEETARLSLSLSLPVHPYRSFLHPVDNG